MLGDLGKDVVWTGSFPVIEIENCLFHFFKGSSSCGMIGRVCKSFRKAGSVAWTLFRRFCRYSANLARIISIVVIREPSILRK